VLVVALDRKVLFHHCSHLNHYHLLTPPTSNVLHFFAVSNMPKHVPSSDIPTADTLDIEAECQKIVLGNEAKPGHSSDKSSETEEFRLKTRSTAAYNNHNFHLTFPFQLQHHLQHHAASTAAEDDIEDEELLITGGDDFILSSIHHQYKEAIDVDIIINNNPQQQDSKKQQQAAGDTDSASFGHHHNQQPDTKATSQKRSHQEIADTTTNKTINATNLMNDLLPGGGGTLAAITTTATPTPGTLMLNMNYEKALESINYQLAADRGVPNYNDNDCPPVMAPFGGDAMSKRRRS
jgi:hypothetical protein